MLVYYILLIKKNQLALALGYKITKNTLRAFAPYRMLIITAINLHILIWICMHIPKLQKLQENAHYSQYEQAQVR